MISKDQNKKLSKLLSYVLRHEPDTLHLHPDKNGWVSVEELLKNMNAAGHTIDNTILKHIVDTNEKKRFAFSEDEVFIRASQGHSFEVDLDYVPMQPPQVLYHGTGEKNLQAILASGLLKMQRHHVHLSENKETARQVGQRRGAPLILLIDSKKMHDDGFIFYRSANGVWLVDFVPAAYIKEDEGLH